MRPMDVAHRFGENLREARKRADLSQEQLGVRAGLHRTEIGLLERGTRVPRIDTLIRIAFSLGVPPGNLLTGMDWTPSGTTTTVGYFGFAPSGDPRSN
jgi:transcriptional regulator with XRE-family HTH domain